MKKTLIFLIAISVTLSCNQTSSKQKTEQAKAINHQASQVNPKLIEKEEKLKALKAISEYEMAFLEVNVDKAWRILGKPDKEMISPNGTRGCYIWYDKVKRDESWNKDIHHLVIEFSRKGSDEIASQVLAVLDSSYFYSSRLDKVFLKKP